MTKILAVCSVLFVMVSGVVAVQTAGDYLEHQKEKRTFRIQ